MDALPIELLEEIISSLLPCIDETRVVSVPVSSKTERADIYNLRLTSRRINAGASQAFLKLIGDVPTECREQSMRNLESLVRLAHVGNRMTCLTFNTCVLFITDEHSIEQINKEYDDRYLWIIHTFRNAILAILRKTLRLRHIICLYEATRGPKEFEFGRGQTVIPNHDASGTLDPMKVRTHRSRSTLIKSNRPAQLSNSRLDLTSNNHSTSSQRSKKLPST